MSSSARGFPSDGTKFFLDVHSQYKYMLAAYTAPVPTPIFRVSLYFFLHVWSLVFAFLSRVRAVPPCAFSFIRDQLFLLFAMGTHGAFSFVCGHLIFSYYQGYTRVAFGATRYDTVSDRLARCRWIFLGSSGGTVWEKIPVRLPQDGNGAGKSEALCLTG